MHTIVFLSGNSKDLHAAAADDQQAAVVVQTANILNESFVSIKVDKEERPDVDHLFMTYLQATQGGGGWWVVHAVLACHAMFRECEHARPRRWIACQCTASRC